jgi:hypothetical protein
MTSARRSEALWTNIDGTGHQDEGRFANLNAATDGTGDIVT